MINKTLSTSVVTCLLVIALSEPVWSRGFGGYNPGYGANLSGVGGYNPGFGTHQGIVGGYNPGFGYNPTGVGGYNPGFGYNPNGVGGFNPGFGYNPTGVGGFNPGFGFNPNGVGGYNPGFGFNPSGVGGFNPGFGTGGVIAAPARQTNRRFPSQTVRDSSDRYSRSGSDPAKGTPRDRNLDDRSRRRSTASSFAGLPSDGGMQSIGHQRSGLDQRGNVRLSAAHLRTRGAAVRRSFSDEGLFTAEWYRSNPTAWQPQAWARADVWGATWDWDSIVDWFAASDVDPIDYDYGNNIVYQDDSVYFDGKKIGAADKFFQQAQDLVDLGTQPLDQDDKWLPLGVFAMINDQHTQPDLILQLAVNPAGIIRGNYNAVTAGHLMQVKGSVDKQTQRAVWSIGNNTETVIETGIHNLTRDEVLCLAHFGEDTTQQWTLVRLGTGGGSAGDETSNSTGNKAR